MNLFEKYDLDIDKGEKTVFWNSRNVFPDGTAAMHRDSDGTLWAITGHSHAGAIVMFKGTCVSDLKKAWEINTNFVVGSAEYAFSGIRYPEGVKPRGSVWPFGLYICPNTHRFFAWFHNETGWNGHGTAYDAFGPCDTPKHDSDFRHVGLMHSDDEGKNWVFDRWVLTAETVCFTELYNPGAGKALGQKSGKICLGAGDFNTFWDPKSDFIYLFYSMIWLNMNAPRYSDAWLECNCYVARTRKRTDGTMGDFVKFHDGSFSEAGNLGKESPILTDCWHAKVAYLAGDDTYVMSSKPIISATRGTLTGTEGIGQKGMQLTSSKDLVNWEKPVIAYRKGKVFGNHYNAIVDTGSTNQVGTITGKEFAFMCNTNGSGITSYPVKLKPR